MLPPLLQAYGRKQGNAGTRGPAPGFALTRFTRPRRGRFLFCLTLCVHSTAPAERERRMGSVMTSKIVCPQCQSQAQLGVELDKRMFARFAEGVHVYCEPCARYQRMRPQEAQTKTAA
jgi:hypothetical protein